MDPGQESRASRAGNDHRFERTDRFEIKVTPLVVGLGPRDRSHLGADGGALPIVEC
jgi:hypothetical protein